MGVPTEPDRFRAASGPGDFLPAASAPADFWRESLGGGARLGEGDFPLPGRTAGPALEEPRRTCQRTPPPHTPVVG